MERLRVIDLDEISGRWQIPVERVKYFITDCGLDPVKTSAWVVDNWDLWMSEKKKAFEEALFPERFRTPTEISAKTV